MLDIRNIPKAEMHLHLEGAFRPDTYVELRRRDEPKFTIEQAPWYNLSYRFNSLDHFLDITSSRVIKSPEDYRRIAFELFEDLSQQNVIYAEVSIASSRISIDEIVAAVNEAYNNFITDNKLELGILIGIVRSRGLQLASEFVDKAIKLKKFRVVGIDLLERETACPAELFQECFQRAAEGGLGLRAHAGEGAGSQSVWEVIRLLGVTRIAHGTRAIEDNELVKFISENNITLDICPTSNYRLNVVNSLQEHPLRKFIDAGIKVTVSSDDPFYFNSNLTDELNMLQSIFSFNREEILQLTINAIDGAFIPSEKKSNLYKIIN